MIAVTSLLVLLGAVAINALALQTVCIKITMGDSSNNMVPLEETKLKPGIADWEVSIPDVPKCPKSAVGVMAIVCDYDVASTAKFANLNLILLHRNGQLQGTGTVQPTVFCPEEKVNNLWPSSNQLSSALNHLGQPNNNLWLTQKQSWMPNNELLTSGLSSQNLWNHQPPQNLMNLQPSQSLRNHQSPQNLWNHQSPQNLMNLQPSQNLRNLQSPQNLWNHQSPQKLIAIPK